MRPMRTGHSVGVNSLLLMVCLMVVTFTTIAGGDIVSFDMTVSWNPASPGGTQPPAWLSATFDDEDSPGEVILTLTATNLMVSEKVEGWYFNLDPNLDPGLLTFSDPNKTGSFDDPNVSVSTNDFMADGDGYFDILILFETADGGTRSFGQGDAVEYTIGGIASLTAGSFEFISFPNGGDGQYITVAKVQGIDGDDSGWVTIPEPSSIVLLSLGWLGLLRKKRK